MMAADSMLASLRAHLPPERVDALVERFRTEALDLVEALRSCSNDATTLGRTAHRLRGKSLVIGAEALANLCATLERDPAADDRSAQLDAIESEVRRLADELG
jgi:HPt (histidine-containing phosphotransfer) domain-containing protein